ncbi:MAG: globin domain-containing protein [Gammaproteobacteria bacterium]
MLSENTKEIIKATAPALQEYGVEITTRMYERMAEEQPDLKALFANTRSGQAERLAGAVLAYAQNIDEIERLASSIAAISKKHVSAKVLPEHYPIVGQLLLAAMHDVLGEALDKKISDAWAEAYTFLADVFIDKEKQLYNQ